MLTGLEVIGVIGSLSSIISLASSLLGQSNAAITDKSESIQESAESKSQRLASDPEVMDLASRFARNRINQKIFDKMKEKEDQIIDSIDKEEASPDEIASAAAQAMCSFLRALRRTGGGKLPKELEQEWNDYGCVQY